jgi:hypothetical protein
MGLSLTGVARRIILPKLIGAAIDREGLAVGGYLENIAGQVVGGVRSVPVQRNTGPVGMMKDDRPAVFAVVKFGDPRRGIVRRRYARRRERTLRVGRVGDKTEEQEQQ